MHGTARATSGRAALHGPRSRSLQDGARSSSPRGPKSRHAGPRGPRKVGSTPLFSLLTAFKESRRTGVAHRPTSADPRWAQRTGTSGEQMKRPQTLQRMHSGTFSSGREDAPWDARPRADRLQRHRKSKNVFWTKRSCASSLSAKSTAEGTSLKKVLQDEGNRQQTEKTGHT